MTLPSPKAVCLGSIVLLWAIALYRGWEFGGIFGDGAYFMFHVLREQRLFDEIPMRRHVTVLNQTPLLWAMGSGLDDLRWLARLFSLSMVGVPTALYSFALIRARRDARVLAVAIAAIAMVFMPTSFTMVGDYNAAHAAAILAAVWLATSNRLGVADGLVLMATAILTLRAYETFIALGPLLALMTVDTIKRSPSRPPLVTALYGAAAVLFAAAMLTGIYSLVTFPDKAHLHDVIAQRWDFITNLQFALVVAAASIVGIWALLAPDDLRGRRPFWLSWPLLVAVALSPLVLFLETPLAPPYSQPQDNARVAGGAVTFLVIVLLWALAAGWSERLRAVSFALKSPAASRRAVAFAGIMLLSMMPWDVMLAYFQGRYVEEVRQTIRTRSGIIPFEASQLNSRRYLWHRDEWATPAVSMILRAAPTDGILAPPAGEWFDTIFPRSHPPDLGPFKWRD